MLKYKYERKETYFLGKNLTAYIQIQKEKRCS